jgi:hypothetical protein
VNSLFPLVPLSLLLLSPIDSGIWRVVQHDCTIISGLPVKTAMKIIRDWAGKKASYSGLPVVASC